jgi:hypothetical protein
MIPVWSTHLCFAMAVEYQEYVLLTVIKASVLHFCCYNFSTKCGKGVAAIQQNLKVKVLSPQACNATLGIIYLFFLSNP